MSTIAAGSLRISRDAPASADAVPALNAELEQAGSPFLLTEKAIESFWSRTLQLEDEHAGRWLLLIRLAEAALLCAGNYADNCEFRAAGDFLVNPREIVIRNRGTGQATVKKRHGRLSEQLGRGWIDQPGSAKRFSARFELEVSSPPLLPAMTRMLRDSARVAVSYVHRLEEGQRRIAEALAFMAGWHVADSVELWRRMRASPPGERAFAQSRMCRFGTEVFGRIGDDVRRSLVQPDYRSSFLCGPHECGRNRRPARRSPAAPPENAQPPA